MAVPARYGQAGLGFCELHHRSAVKHTAFAPAILVSVATHAARVARRSRLSDVLVLAALLAGYGNAASLALAGATPAGGWSGVAVGMAPAAALLVWGVFSAGLSVRDFGLEWRGAARSAGVGLCVALALAAIAIAFLHAPPVVGQPVSHAPLNSLSEQALVWRTFVWMPLDTALPEEIAFRGVLLAALAQHLPRRRAIIVSAIAFMAWHAVIVARTVAVTNLAGEPLLALLGLVGALAAVFVGGIVFAGLRLMTGNLAGSIFAHWAFNAVLLFGIYAPLAERPN
jgi:CAAX protease family protein